MHHGQGTLLGIGGKHLLHEGLSQRLAEGRIGGVRTTFPAWQQDLGPGQIVAVKREGLVDEARSQGHGVVGNRVPAQIGTKLGKRCGFEQAIEPDEETGDRHVDGSDLGQIADEVTPPRKMRRGRLEAGAIDPVVHVLRIPPVDQRHRGLRELGFELQHDVGVRGGSGRGLASEDEHAHDVAAVGLAQLARFRILLQVVFAIGQSQPALVGFAYYLRGVAKVLIRAEGEEHTEGAVLHPAHEHGQLVEVGDRRDAGQPVGQGFPSGLGHRRLVHAGGVEVAHPMRVGLARVDLPGGVGLEDAVQDVLVAFVDCGEGSGPRRAIGRNRGAREPGAACVLVEVLAG